MAGARARPFDALGLDVGVLGALARRARLGLAEEIWETDNPPGKKSAPGPFGSG